MKLNFSVRRLNSPFDDSAVFLRGTYMKKALLFDCGRLGNLENSELLDIAHVFISHTHMDHFAGFDRFLRGCLNSGNVVRFYGPPGIIGNVKGKIAGYNWNLIKDYDLTFEVFELLPGAVRFSSFSAKNGFEEKGPEDFRGALELGSGYSISYEFFDHGVVSVGYRVKEPVFISVSKEKLKERGLLPGPWIKGMKEALLSEADPSSPIEVSASDGIKTMTLGEAATGVAEYKKPADIVYITDIAPSFENYKKALALAKGAALLLIEAVFSNSDVSHAIAKNHLTTGLARGIFRESGADKVQFGHFAPRYDRQRKEFFKELYAGLEGRVLRS